MFLFVLTIAGFTNCFAQTTLSGTLINAPGSSTQAIPSRDVVLELYDDDPESFLSPIFYDDDTNTSRNYSISFSGGPFFLRPKARVYVDLSTDPNTAFDFNCIKTNDLVAISGFLSGTITLTDVQKVAADVNLDGTVDLDDKDDKDMIENVILGNISNYTNTASVAGSNYNNRRVVYPATNSISSTGSSVSYSFVRNYSSSSISGTTSGVNFYSIRLGDVNGDCANYSSLTNEPGSSNFLKKDTFFDPKNELKTLPNPFTESLLITFGESEGSELAIFNISGKIVKSLLLEEGASQVVLEDPVFTNLPSGIYLIHAKQKLGGVITRKVIKE